MSKSNITQRRAFPSNLELLSMLVLVATPSLLAQTPFGRITGRDMDSSGSVIVKGAIKVKQVETNITTTSATSSSGVYELQNLIPGNYLIVVEAKGFKKLERGPVQVRISDLLKDSAVQGFACSSQIGPNEPHARKLPYFRFSKECTPMSPKLRKAASVRSRSPATIP